MKILACDFVMFLVSDLSRAVAFYRDALGLRCELESLEHQWAEFDCGNVTLSLKGRGLADDVRGGGRIALAVDDVTSAYEELKRRGVPLESAPVDNGCCWHLEVPDPDGNLVILHKRANGTHGQDTKSTA
jgi:catechol 2,3-dioxygenase-like lactoylglutathione lyase family enzyme